MFTSVQGIYRGGKIDLMEVPQTIIEETPVIVTFLPANTINLDEFGINKTEAATLRAHLAIFAEDWNSPEMDIYDDYEAIKSGL